MKRPVRREVAEGELALDGARIPYTLKRSSARRTLALRVDEAGAVTVNAPLALAGQHIEAFLHKHAGWIRERLEALAAHAVTWAEGTELPYLGAACRLSLDGGAGKGVALVGEALRVAGGAEEIERRVTAWYRREANRVLRERLAFHAQRLGRPVPPMRLSNARTRWGSLSPRGVVSLNWRLVKASWAEIDYVICHELAHFRERNHSPRFWAEVAALLPGYEPARERLRHEGRRYFAF